MSGSGDALPFLADLPPPSLADAFSPPPPRYAARDAASDGGDPGEPVGPFVPGVLELGLGVGFDGFGYGPLSILGAIGGWNELAFTLDGAVGQVQDIGIGVGFELWAARPVLYEAFAEGLVGLFVADDDRFDWQAWDAGLAARTTFHYTALEVLDPYGVLLLGPRRYALQVHTLADGELLEAHTASWGLRLGAGAGVTVNAGRGWLANVELRYLVGVKFTGENTLVLTDESGEQPTVYSIPRYARGPRGFAWGIGVRRRF